jgi:hypothetical protein
MRKQSICFVLLCVMHAHNCCRCDEVNLDGSLKPLGQERSSYSHAQKMRASMTYAFGRVLKLGALSWHQSEGTGRWIGNPSVSDVVSTYMLSLRRRKVGFGCTRSVQ